MEPKTEKTKERDGKNPNISKFREVRFKSIEEAVEETENEKEYYRIQIKKLKLEPHKFKDATTKSLLNKYNETLPETEFDDPGVVPISQEKKLVRRTTFYRRTQKDPFVLINRKERVSRGFFPDS